MTAERRARRLLAAGAAAGLALAATGLVRAPSAGRGLPAGVVATVNGEPIRTDDYARALAAIATDRRAPLGDDDKRRVLDRLVAEELLLQRALELGLARHDRMVRGQLVAAAIDLVGAGDDGREPSRADLEAFYTSHRDYFAEAGRVRVEQVTIHVPAGADEPAALARARDAARRLRAGEPIAAVRRDLGDEEVAPIPAVLLPPGKLREYLGDTATREAMALEPGAASDPVRSGTGYHVLRILEREPVRVRPFDEIVDTVRTEYRRRRDEDAFRAALETLRRHADVRVTEVLP